MGLERFLLSEELGLIMVNYLGLIGLYLHVIVFCVIDYFRIMSYLSLLLQKVEFVKTLRIQDVYLKTRVRINLTLPRKRYLQKCPK